MSRPLALVDATMLDGDPSGAATRLAALGAAHAAAGRWDVVHLVRPGVDPLPGLRCEPFGGSDTPLRRARAGTRLDALARRLRAAVVQCGALPLPRATSPLLLTVHDLRWLDADAPPLRRLWVRTSLRRNLARAARLVAVSRSTAEGLRAAGLADDERLVLAPNAGTPGLRRAEPEAIAALRRRLDLNVRYVLAIGPVERHKRPGALVEALALARAQPGGADLALLVAGRADAGAAQTLAERARGLGVLAALRVPGQLSDSDLATALSGADALAVASRVEGFGIPVVDAQALEVPVVAVAAGALPEVVGEGGWLVPPGDAPALAAALVAAVTPGAARDAGLARGLAAAGRWSWDESAARLEEAWGAVSGRG